MCDRIRGLVEGVGLHLPAPDASRPRAPGQLTCFGGQREPGEAPLQTLLREVCSSSLPMFVPQVFRFPSAIASCDGRSTSGFTKPWIYCCIVFCWRWFFETHFRRF